MTMRTASLVIMSAAAGALFTMLFVPRVDARIASHEPKNGSLIEHDSLVKASQPGPHRGTGTTTGYSFFAKTADLKMVFRKRALHPGASIGHHQQREDEIYYVLGGRGELTLDGDSYDVGPGTAILTRTGSTHSIRQVGTEDLVLLIAYERMPAPPRARRDSAAP
jgi:mannose-6-phosphate isomerase-like protein (cupin superfamily)